MKKFNLMACSALIIAASLCTACGKKTVEEETYRSVKVDKTEGSVVVERDENMDAISGMMLIPDDVVVVGAGSETILLADSDKHIYANEDSSFSIYTEGDENKGKVKIDLLYGDVKFVIDNKLNADSEFNVVTPNASLSVRGTTFQVAYDKENDITLVSVDEGVVYADYTGNFADEEINAGELRVIDANEVVDSIANSRWNTSFIIYDIVNNAGNGVDVADNSGNDNTGDANTPSDINIADYSGVSVGDGLTFVNGGTVTDTCLEYRHMFIDFAAATEVFPGAEITKRSESNVVIYFNKGTEDGYDVQYSTLASPFEADRTREIMFPNGYETLTLEDGHELLFFLEFEAEGTRIIILQDIDGENCVSIRCFNKTGMDTMEMIKKIVVQSYYPIHILQ